MRCNSGSFETVIGKGWTGYTTRFWETQDYVQFLWLGCGRIFGFRVSPCISWIVFLPGKRAIHELHENKDEAYGNANIPLLFCAWFY